MTATWWLGRPGMMQALARPPARDYDRSADDAVNTTELLDGRAMQRRPHALRTFPYQWAWLTMADWSTLAALRARAYGPGPYALIDAATLNLLTDEQSTGYAAGYRVTYGSVSTVAPPASPAIFAQAVQWTIPSPDADTIVFAGSLAPGDDNAVHDFDVPDGTTGIDVVLDGPAGADMDLELDDQTGTQVAQSAGGTADEHIDYTGTITAGSWRVQVLPFAGSGAYTVTITLSPPPDPPADAGVLAVPHPVWPHGHPTPAGGQWSWTSWLQSPDTVSITAAIVWRDAAGTSLSETTSSATALSDGTWTAIAATGTAPAGAVYADLQLRTASTDVTIYLGGGRLAVGDDSDTWYPGEGLPAVSIAGMTETVPVYDRRSVALTLAEVRR